MKKILLSLSIILCLALGLVFSGCKEIIRYTDVATYAELKENQGKAVRLTADIDCDFENVTSMRFGHFDGGNFKIKNAVLSGNGFFAISEPAVIKNVTFENITVNSNGIKNVGIVLSSYSDKPVYGTVFENLTVCNSKINAQYAVSVGAIMGKATSARGVSSANGEDKSRTKSTQFKNCKIYNVEFDVNGENDRSISDVYVGGLVGYGEDVIIENSSVANCSFKVNSQSSSSTPYFGSLAGLLKENALSTGKIVSSYADSVECDVTGYAYVLTMGLPVDVTEVVMGGLVGSCSLTGGVNTSFVSNSDLHAISTGRACVGGLLGQNSSSVYQCYTSGNDISAGYLESNCSYNHFVAGFIAGADKCAISSSFSADNNVYIREIGFATWTEVPGDAVLAGFVANASSVSFSFCAAYNSVFGTNNTVAERFEEFAYAGTVYNCYVTDPIYKSNTLNLDKLSQEVWKTAELKTVLNLSDGRWNFEEGKLPSLKF